MKFKKAVIPIGIGILALALIAGCGLFASRGPHPFFNGRPHPGFRGRDFSKHFLTHLDSRVKTLDLTELQKRKYEEIRAKIEADMAAMKERRKDFLEKIREEIHRENPDMNSLALMIKERLEPLPQHIGAHMDTFMEFYNVLDKDQKAKIHQKIREKLDRLPSQATAGEKARKYADSQVNGE
ncbi:MAG: Spy/CpxP family protein refolding chaperone [Pseudomonadota bacterium]